MDSGNTNNLNNENINPNLDNVNEDLTNIFDTPVDFETTNLGVGETTNEYSNEDTEILDLNEISEFKEAEIKVENLDINTIANSETTVESNPFELNNVVSENVEMIEETETSIINNEVVDYTPSAVDNLNPVSLDSLNNGEEVVINNAENNMQEEIVEMNSEVSTQESSINSELSVAEEEIIEPSNESSMVQEEIVENSPETITQEPIMDTTEVKVKKKKNILPIIIILILVAIVGALAAVYFLVLTTPKNIFNKALESGVEYLSASFTDFGKYNTITGNGSLSYEIKSEDANMQTTLDLFNGIALNYEYGIDYNNKLMNLNLDSTYNNEKLLDLDMYTENNKAYMLFVDIYNTYITTPIEGYDDLFNMDINQEEISIIINSFSSALSKSLTDEDFVKSEEILKINGEEVKTNKNSFVLNDKNVNRISKSVITNLKDDADFISAFNRIINDNSVDIKSILEDTINNIGETDGSDTVIAVSIYTKGIMNEVVGFSAEVKDDETIKMFVNKTDSVTYSIVITKGSEELMTGSIRANINKTETTNNSNIELMLSMKNYGSLKLNLDNNTNYNAIFNKPDISKNITMEELPENWMTNIATGAMNNPGFAKLMTNIQTISAQKEAETQQELENIQNQTQSMETNYNY